MISGGNFLNRLRACVSASGVETTVHTMKDSYVVDFERINQEYIKELGRFSLANNCSVMITSSGIQVKEDPQKNPEGTLSPAVLHRIRKMTKRTPGNVRKQTEDTLKSICGFSLTHFMPNFTIEEISGGVSIVCNMARVFALDLAQLDVEDLHYENAYLYISITPHIQNKRRRDEGPEDASTIGNRSTRLRTE